ncbi:MAG: 6,7-dimethyl-8-ribityllumazine synthase [Nanoarchaeota archaeon]|nr:6,7-dimethyl-8-ribityllumazine synthase [Nanoarchaeota archaeon]
MRIGIVIGEFHKEISTEMLDRAKKKCTELGVECDAVWVPGTYEAPIVVRKFLRRDDIDCVVVMGYIEQGETLHGEQMGHTTSLILKQLELEFSKPVGMGLIGPGATKEQAMKRLDYGAKAVEAAVKMCSIK